MAGKIMAILYASRQPWRLIVVHEKQARKSK